MTGIIWCLYVFFFFVCFANLSKHHLSLSFSLRVCVCVCVCVSLWNVPLEIKSFKGTALLMSVNCCDSQGGLPPLSPLSSISHTSSSPFPCSFPLSLFPWLFTLSQYPLYPWLSLPSRLSSALSFFRFFAFFPHRPNPWLRVVAISEPVTSSEEGRKTSQKLYLHLSTCHSLPFVKHVKAP